MTTLPKPSRGWRRILPWLAVTTVLAACSGPPTDTGTSQAPPQIPAGALHSVAFVVNASPADGFWSVVKNGAQAAGKQLGIRVDYYAATDPGAQARLIDNAIAQGVDGLAVNMPYPEPLRPAIQRAAAAHIPFVTVNHGATDGARMGSIGHVGLTERLDGRAAGGRLHDAGKTKLLCVNHMSGELAGDEFCGGAAQGFGTTVTIPVDINNPADVQSRIKGALQSDRSIDAVLTLNAQIASRAAGAVHDAHSTAAVGAMTVDNEVIQEIRDGQVLFTADSQQYEQGYLPIVMLQLYKTNLNTVDAGKPVETGPTFIDKSNVEAVAPLVTQGTR